MSTYIVFSCTFIGNSALFEGSAIAAPSYARADTATAPILINNWYIIQLRSM